MSLLLGHRQSLGGMEMAYVDAKREVEHQPDDDNWCKSASNL